MQIKKQPLLNFFSTKNNFIYSITEDFFFFGQTDVRWRKVHLVREVTVHRAAGRGQQTNERRDAVTGKKETEQWNEITKKLECFLPVLQEIFKLFKQILIPVKTQFSHLWTKGLW